MPDGRPYPRKCKCWQCSTPVSVIAVPETVSGNNCCNYPIGTFTVGGASTGTITSTGAYYRIPADAASFTPTPFGTNTPCWWFWRYIPSEALQCSASGWGIGGTDLPLGGTYVTLCAHELDALDTNIDLIFVMDELFVAVSYSIELVLYVQRTYRVWACNKTTTAITFLFQIDVMDEYRAGFGFDCASLPSDIAFTSRIFSDISGSPNWSRTGDVLTYVSGNTFTVCPYIPSLGVTF